MKKFAYFIPVLIFLAFSFFSTRMFAAGSLNPISLIIITVAIMGTFLIFRPKTAAPKPVGDLEKKVRGEFAKDAFSDNPQLGAKFQSALKDYSGNMPKSAINKLTKLASECRTGEEKYAVAIATALCMTTVGKYPEAIRQYNKAIVLHPTSEHILAQGSCYQRLGELKKAIDAYQFALELDEKNIEARSALATAYVADRDYDTALHHAMLALEQNENHASSLATAAICYGLLDEPLLHEHYTDLAVANGYNRKKITETVSALKKR